MNNQGTVSMEDMIIVLLISCPLIFFFFQMISKYNSSWNQPPVPPGPSPWPIVGNFFHIGKKNLHVHLAEMAQLHGPLMSLRLGHQIVIVGSSPTVASEILKTCDHALSGREVSLLLRDTYLHNASLVFTCECDDGWRILRNIYKSEFSSSKGLGLESRTQMREDKVVEMMKVLSSMEGEDIIIMDIVFITLMNILSNTSLSMDFVDFKGNGIGAGVMKPLRRLVTLAIKPRLADMYPILSRWDLQGWLKEVIHIMEHEVFVVWEDILNRKRNGSSISSTSKDFADILIEKGFTNQQINPLLQEIFMAGMDTTSSTIEWFIVELLRNPEVMRKARNEVTKNIHGDIVKESDLIHFPFLEACFKETLRLHPPVPLLLAHKATQTCEIMGYTIPKDSQIQVNIWAINRDPNLWDDPLSFKPERFLGSKLNYKGNNYEYIPFGSGRRMCPGDAMGSKMVLLIIVSLIFNFDWFLPNNMNPNQINMEEEMELALHKKEPLHLTLKIRHHVKS